MTYTGPDLTGIANTKVEIVITEDMKFHKLGYPCEYLDNCKALDNRPELVRGKPFAGDLCKYTHCRDCPEWLERKGLKENE